MLQNTDALSEAGALVVASVLSGCYPHGLAAFRERRERAAALWHAVPRGSLRMASWECGAKACALGWLAAEGLDGWGWEQKRGVRPRRPLSPDGLPGYAGAARWFGLAMPQSAACFGAGRVSEIA